MARFDQNHSIAAVLTGVLDRFRVRRTLPALAPDERLDGKLALVTGRASGLGFATSVDLARRGARLDRLVFNAAIVPTAARATPQGLDEMFVVNYLSSFALVTRLLDEGLLPHAAGPSRGGWTIVVVYDSKEDWERFRDGVLMPKMKQGIKGGFATPPQETGFEVYNLQP
jgi:hypothetical protein